MSIRLNKAIRELNIGIQTVSEFLEKKYGIESVDPNLKLTDEQYSALKTEFSTDAEVRNQAEQMLQKKDKKSEKKEAASAAEPAKTEQKGEKQTFNVLGKIDLDRFKKPSKAAKNKTVAAEPVKAEPAEKAEMPAPKQEKAEQKPEKTETPAAPETTKAIAPAVVEQSAPAPEKPEPEPKAQEPAGGTDDNGVFRLERNKKPAFNVLGKIDLSAINQSTRPKKKSKEEKKKEREEKAQQARDQKKKRARIGKERVDINDVANQPKKGKGGNNGGQNANANAGAQGNNKKSKKKNRRSNQPQEVDDEAVARQVKETLARLTNKQTQNKKGAKYRKDKRDAAAEQRDAAMAAEAAESKVLKLTEYVTVSELATMMDVPVTKLIGTLMSIGVMVSINQRLDAETINMVAEEFGFSTEYVSAEVQNAITEEADEETDLQERAPIVTVMGHVDHGKTSLLDYVRNTNVIAGEAGGITQHIGAYNVKLADGRKITFLDTPGHEAFTAMRARGTQVTDIAIIIIAADDSVMPTTKEAIAHAQAANVPMVFAINKIDKPGANPDKIREDLAQMNLLVEEWGGKYQCQEISAKSGLGVDELMEKVLLEAEMLELKANPNRKATGSIIEASLDKGRGFISTVLVSNGTLHVGDIVIAGTYYGRVKAMFNERNQRVQQAAPAEPVIILGLNGAPSAGDSFHIMETEQEAREIANKRQQLQREQSLRTTKTLSLEEIAHRIALGEFHILNLIVKADTQGSVEALTDSFIKLSTEKVEVKVIQGAVGAISENDVMLASTAENGMIVGFNVRPSVAAKKLAENEGVEINTYSVIYDAIDDITSAMEGMLDKVKKEIATGTVEVKEVFKISKVGTVAGAMVTDGKVHRSDKARLIRDGIVIFTGNINALKRYKDDAKEVATGLECGISLVNCNDIQSGDIIETFTEIEVEQHL
ncbi:MAG: translation initiation factor IF-2 [Bacteroidales bacterium]|nr:translation initiation factor IF-2 [Bacteroidales bacterium]MCM1146870.1 translation initiation factor IF-2 [Bacteroidales bacterium]MCM1205632.1 translation initiation factor IF-2 [Bacillota bacterium]MCM1510256.1 translation initiation factor IF-2 [Clostridium sp.]